MAVGLFDFLSDGLHIKKRGFGNLYLGLLIAAPSLLGSIFIERVFLNALEMSGGVGDSILCGGIPATMVWIGRYYKKYRGSYQVSGGRGLLIYVFIFSFCILSFEILRRL